MNQRQRVMAAIRHERPDRVPKGEIDIAPPLVAGLLGHAPDSYDSQGVPFEDAVRVRELLNMDLDAVVLNTPEPVDAGTDSIGNELVGDVWGNTRVVDKERVFDPYIVRHAIAEAEQIRSYSFPDPASFTGKDISLWCEQADFFVFALISGVFETVNNLCGLDNFAIWSCSDPDDVKDLLLRAGSFQAGLADIAVDAGADGVLISDDMASNKGTFFSPATLKPLVFEPLGELVQTIHRKSVPAFLHCDGNINAILTDIADCGFDGLQAIQPSAGMSLGHVKQCVGDRLCLMGNIDLDQVLPFGTEEEVRQAVKDAIDVAADGSGYIVSTCNILTRDVPPANAIAMYEATETYGSYEERQ